MTCHWWCVGLSSSKWGKYGIWRNNEFWCWNEAFKGRCERGYFVVVILHTYCTRLRLVIRLYHQHPDNQGNEMWRIFDEAVAECVPGDTVDWDRWTRHRTVDRLYIPIGKAIFFRSIPPSTLQAQQLGREAPRGPEEIFDHHVLGLNDIPIWRWAFLHSSHQAVLILDCKLCFWYFPRGKFPVLLKMTVSFVQRHPFRPTR